MPRLLRLVKGEEDCWIILRGWAETTEDTLRQALKQLRSFDIGEYYLEVKDGENTLVIAANIYGSLLLLAKRITRKRIEKLLAEIERR